MVRGVERGAVTTVGGTTFTPRAAPIRTLVVGEIDPNGNASGSRQRLLVTIRGLAALGDVDYLHWRARPWRGRARAGAAATSPPIHAVWHTQRRTTPDRLRPVHRAAWTLRAIRSLEPVTPYAVTRAAVPSASAVTDAVPDIGGYDLIWCFEAPSAAAILECEDASGVPVVADVEAVHHLIGPDGEVLLGAAAEPSRSTGGRMNDLYARYERAAIHEWITRLAERVASVVFTNPIEAAVFDLDNGEIIENGCDVPPYRGAHTPSDPAVLTFVGWTHYPPNADAAVYLATEVVPRLHRALGDGFELRIVGSATARVRRLASAPNVVVTGFVGDLASELAAADVVLAPIRSGAGTRIKLLDAFAHQVPVVSSRFGALGLDVEDRVHLLLADDTDAVVDRCVQLLWDLPLRDRLVRHAYDYVARRHAWPVIERRVATVARTALDPPADHAG